MLKKFLSCLVILALLAGLWIVPAGAYGDEEPAPDDMFLPEGSSESGDLTLSGEDEEDSPALMFSFAPAQDGGEEDSSLPSSYDPRQSYTLPAIRNQGSWNTCWLMASTAAAEFSMLGSSDLSAVNLSERHLVYFLAHQADDPLQNSSGDYNTDTSFWIQTGGNPIIAMMALSNWHGIASEAATDTPYSGLSVNDSVSAEYAYSAELHLENTMALNLSTAAERSVLKQMIMDYGSAVLCMYYKSTYLFAGTLPTEGDDSGDASDEPETSESGETGTDPQTPETTSDGETSGTDTPQPSDTPDNTDNTDNADGSDTSETTDTSDISDTPDTSDSPETAETSGNDGAAESTGVAMDGASDMTAPVSDSTAAESSDTDGEYTVCYYQDTYTSTNHEVLVIGWDDDYPAENFGLSSAGAVPEGDGAWLCRNSYGSSWAGGDGYFWVSYYDATVSYDTNGDLDKARAVVFDYGSADNYDNLYEYDGSVVMGYVTGSADGTYFSVKTASGSTRSYANIFTASASAKRGHELLNAVSTYTYFSGVPYTMTVYTGLTDSIDPTSGTPVASQSGTFTYAGFHTLTLDTPIILYPGESYSVVFTISAADNNSIYIPACYTLQAWRSVNDSTEGQSFVKINNGTWYDCQSLAQQANVRIKAYTDTVNYDFPFTDVTEDSWFYGDVYDAWAECLVDGTSASQYSPNAAATRAAAVTVLYRMAGSPQPEGTASFDDVVPGSWYYDAVCWGQENGLILGYDDDGDGVYSFRPNTTLSRQEFVTILYRYAVMTELDITNRDSLRSFTDAKDIASWALTAEQWSVGCGIQQGSANDDGTVSLLPYATVTRAMMAAYLIRIFNMS